MSLIRFIGASISTHSPRANEKKRRIYSCFRICGYLFDQLAQQLKIYTANGDTQKKRSENVSNNQNIVYALVHTQTSHYFHHIEFLVLRGFICDCARYSFVSIVRWLEMFFCRFMRRKCTHDCRAHALVKAIHQIFIQYLLRLKCLFDWFSPNKCSHVYNQNWLFRSIRRKIISIYLQF